MISTKRKRKILFEDVVYYWHISKDENDHPIIHISSEDKKVHLHFPFDKELSLGTSYIENLLEKNL